MASHIVRPVLFADSPVIEFLDSATILGVADRLSTASTFEEFVYRESEMDALFTLADIALTVTNDTLQDDDAHRADLIKIRELIFAAHDLTHENNVQRAIALLEQAAQIVAPRNGRATGLTALD